MRPPKPPPRPTRRWEWVGVGLIVFARTKSEARALFRKKTGRKHLPAGVIIREVL